MLSPAEADAIIAKHVKLLPAEDCPLAAAHGRVLRQPIVADRDLPPYDRVTMDGYALQAAALASGTREFRIIATQAAGMRPKTLTKADESIEIATGAVLPIGADCVVPYEQTEREGERMRVVAAENFAKGSNVHHRASDHRAGDELVSSGTRLTGREIAVAAACGQATLRVAIHPRIAVVATGDELAEVEAQSIAPHQIRRSNDHALRAALIAGGYPRVERFHIRDQRDELRHVLQRLLSEFDVLAITGGVSKGKFDFLPSVLTELGVNKLVDGVAQRPGRPFWFGIGPKALPVFALPGNPVSAYTCCTRYLLPALAQMSGCRPEPSAFVQLAESVHFRPRLARLLPVRVRLDTAGVARATPAEPNTSGDFTGLLGTDGFVELPADQENFPVGSSVGFWKWP